MKNSITIVAPFMVLGETPRVILPCRPCEARAHDGIVQIAYPYSPFTLPYDKFHKLMKDGSIAMERILS